MKRPRGILHDIITDPRLSTAPTALPPEEEPPALQEILQAREERESAEWEPPAGEGKRSRAKLPPGTPPRTKKWTLRP